MIAGADQPMNDATPDVSSNKIDKVAEMNDEERETMNEDVSSSSTSQSDTESDAGVCHRCLEK